ncbi:hypothetical protein KRM28CT15_66130 [Krasilnikovia sp. M28-CT-15]
MGSLRSIQLQSFGKGFHTPVVASTTTTTPAQTAYPRHPPPDATPDNLTSPGRPARQHDSPVSSCYDLNAEITATALGPYF